MDLDNPVIKLCVQGTQAEFKGQADLAHQRWNRIALERANAVGDERVQPFYPSLYLNMGQSYELLGNHEESRRYYALAAELGAVHDT
jgi:hypothetical protein